MAGERRLSGLCLTRARVSGASEVSDWLGRVLYGRIAADSPGISNLPQRLFKYLWGLATLDQMPVIQDDGRDGINSLMDVKMLERLGFCHVLVGAQNLARAIWVQSQLAAQPNQRFVIAGFSLSVK